MSHAELNLESLRAWRKEQWSQHPMVERLGETQGLLAHAPQAGASLMDMHGKPARERIDAVIAACTQALRDRPDLGPRLRHVVPLLAREKMTRAGYDARQIDAFAAAARTSSQAEKQPVG